MIKQIFCSLLVLIFFASCENRYRKGRPSSPSPESVSSKFVGKTSDDAYQVSASEYNENFVSRYGLLYLKASNDPFSGRILTVEMGESGEFVSSDETWREGKKHGKSSKWFSNGIKMYERNYNEGRWHGSVTRWWPNGQKMYIRAYTNGVRHGSEATWRSDGTPLSLPANGTPAAIESEPVTEESADSLPGVDLESSAVLPTTDIEPAVNDFTPVDPLTTDEPAPIGLPDPLGQPAEESSTESFSDLPTFPPMEEEVPELTAEENSLPEPNGIEENPILPPDLAAPDALPPAIPESSPDQLPVLPGFEEADDSQDNAPLPLPGLPAESDDGGLPSLPGMEDDGGLPPLPGGGDDNFGDLPPLPPLP